jgi:hypothetical protein
VVFVKPLFVVVKPSPFLEHLLVNLTFLVAGGLIGGAIYAIAYGFGMAYLATRLLVTIGAFAWLGSAAYAARVLFGVDFTLEDGVKGVVCLVLSTAAIVGGLGLWCRT